MVTNGQPDRESENAHDSGARRQSAFETEIRPLAIALAKGAVPLLSLAVIIGIAVAAVWTIVPKPHEAAATVRVLTSDFMLPNGSQHPDQRTVEAHMALLRSDAVVHRVIRENGPEALFGPDWSSRITYEEDAAEMLVSRLRIGREPGGDAFVLAYRDTDPMRAARTVNTLIETYRDVETDTRREVLDSNREHHRRHAEALRGEIESARTAIAALRREERLIGPIGQPASEQSLLTVNSRISNLNADTVIDSSSDPDSDPGPADAEDGDLEVDVEAADALDVRADLLAQSRDLEDQTFEQYEGMQALRVREAEMDTLVSSYQQAIQDEKAADAAIDRLGPASLVLSAAVAPRGSIYPGASTLGTVAAVLTVLLGAAWLALRQSLSGTIRTREQVATALGITAYGPFGAGPLNAAGFFRRWRNRLRMSAHHRLTGDRLIDSRSLVQALVIETRFADSLRTKANRVAVVQICPVKGGNTGAGVHGHYHGGSHGRDNRLLAETLAEEFVAIGKKPILIYVDATQATGGSHTMPVKSVVTGGLYPTTSRNVALKDVESVFQHIKDGHDIVVFATGSPLDSPDALLVNNLADVVICTSHMDRDRVADLERAFQSTRRRANKEIAVISGEPDYA